MLDVDRRDDRDAGLEEVLDVLPPLLVTASGHVGVGQLVDEGDGGGAREDGVHVHLLERRAPVVDLLAGHDVEVADLRLRLRPAVGLDEAHDDVGASTGPPPTLVEHGEGLADPRRGAEVDDEHAAMAPSRASGLSHGRPAALSARPGRGSTSAR